VATVPARPTVVTPARRAVGGREFWVELIDGLEFLVLVRPIVLPDPTLDDR
jgi:hypothetical protein